MKYLRFPVKARKGQKVIVTFDQPTVIKLLSDREFGKYRDCRTHRYYGGQVSESPVSHVIPNDGLWQIVVEKGSTNQPLEVSASVEVLPPPEPVKVEPEQLEENLEEVSEEQNIEELQEEESKQESDSEEEDNNEEKGLN